MIPMSCHSGTPHPLFSVTPPESYYTLNILKRSGGCGNIEESPSKQVAHPLPHPLPHPATPQFYRRKSPEELNMEKRKPELRDILLKATEGWAPAIESDKCGGPTRAEGAWVVLALMDLTAAIREQNALLAQATHPSRCPCDACRDVP